MNPETFGTPLPQFKHQNSMEVLHAIKGSMNKWWKILHEGAGDRGRTDCPLCHLFNYHPSPCQHCPIEIVAKQPLCLGTPYTDWKQAFPWGTTRCLDQNSPKAARVAAKEEFKFLRKLRNDYLRWWMAAEVNDATPGIHQYPHATALAEATIDHFTSPEGILPWHDQELPYEIALEFIEEVR